MDTDLLKQKVLCPISTAELERRWQAVRDLMEEEKIDFLLIQNSEDYLGGYVRWFTDLPAVHGYPYAVIFPREGEMTTIRHGSSDPRKPGPPAYLLRGVKKRISAPIMLSLNFTTRYDGEKVVEELKPYPNARISFVNEGAMTAGFSTHVRKHLPGATFIDITDEIDVLKAVKSPEEIERIKASAHLHDLAWEACLEAIRPGATEFEVAAMIRLKCRMLGSEQQFALIGSAPAGKAFPYNPIHAMNRKLADGDQVGVLIEAADAGGYYTHMHRIACIGSIPEELEAKYELAKEAQALSLNMLKPGADPTEILSANNEFLKSRGYEGETRLYAHGQGYDLVERPAFQPGETMKIEAGMNIAVHPHVGNPRATAIICDNYIVTETGVSECIHKTPKKVFVV